MLGAIYIYRSEKEATENQSEKGSIHLTLKSTLTFREDI